MPIRKLHSILERPLNRLNREPYGVFYVYFPQYKSCANCKISVKTITILENMQKLVLVAR